jgi:hypothetical protein
MTENTTNTYSATDVAKMLTTGNYVPTAGEIRPELDLSFWQNARVLMPTEVAKVPISKRPKSEIFAPSNPDGYPSRNWK